jgi:hypothetical protein
MRSTIALSVAMPFIVFGAWTANLVCAHPQFDTAMTVSPVAVGWE